MRWQVATSNGYNNIQFHTFSKLLYEQIVNVYLDDLIIKGKLVESNNSVFPNEKNDEFNIYNIMLCSARNIETI